MATERSWRGQQEDRNKGTRIAETGICINFQFTGSDQDNGHQAQVYDALSQRIVAGAKIGA